MKNKPLSPLEKLISEKHRIRNQCRIQEQQLNNDWEYIRQNFGQLLISGLASIFFSKHYTSENTDRTTSKTTSPFSDLFAITTETWSIIWHIIKPLLINWGIAKIQSWMEKIQQKQSKTEPSQS